MLAGAPYAIAPENTTPCAYRGKFSRMSRCDLCGMKGQQFEIMSCQLHGECSATRRHSKVRSCAACSDFIERSNCGPQFAECQAANFVYRSNTSYRRNLIVHCYPRKSGMWRRTVNHLAARWPIFTGRKIITIAGDDSCDEPEDVIAAFPIGCEFIIKLNNRPLQEVASFVPMLERIESRDANEITTYVHCKGSTQPAGHASHLWCDGMAAANLDYPQLLDRYFDHGANVVGAFRSHGLWAFPGYHNWHFAGTWFTFRHSRIFGELNWRNVHPNFMGVEAWPGIVPMSESGCMFFDNADTAHLYSPEFWRQNILPSMSGWRAGLENAGVRPFANAR